LPDYIAPTRSHGLVDILDRVLDKGLVIAGDIKINLANVELLTIQVRLLVCSIDKAASIGMNWWQHDPRLTTQAPEGGALRPGEVEKRLERIEQQLRQLTERSGAKRRPSTSTE
jgi:gas vesicle protein GvpA/GvpJ/GvpM family